MFRFKKTHLQIPNFEEHHKSTSARASMLFVDLLSKRSTVYQRLWKLPAWKIQG